MSQGGLCFWPEQLEERSLPFAEMRPAAEATLWNVQEFISDLVSE